jgi:hypothetical protein
MTRAARGPENLQGKGVALGSSFGCHFAVSPVAGMVQAATCVSPLLVIASYEVARDLGGSEWIMYSSKGILVGTSAELAASLIMPDTYADSIQGWCGKAIWRRAFRWSLRAI